MKILFLSTNDILGGAANVTHRLAKALRHEGVDARMLVAHKQTADDWVETVNPLKFAVAKVVERGEIFAFNGLSIRDLWKVSTASCGCGVWQHKLVREADVIVINWVCQGLVSLKGIEKLCKLGKPVIWIMHDLWCATGICHLPGECQRYKCGCGECQLLNWEKSVGDLSRRTWQKKMHRLSPLPIHYIAVSEWQQQMAAQSLLLRDKNIEVLHHAFPVGDFYIEPKEGCTDYRRGKKLVVMGAARLDDPIKNLSGALDLLNAFAEKYGAEAADTHVVFFGNIKTPSVISGLRLSHEYVGALSDAELKNLYSQATVVLSTSYTETMGATLMEGMAGGATAVSTPSGGPSSIITPETGYFLPSARSREFLTEGPNVLYKALTAPFERETQHASVETRFSEEAIARRFMSIIGSLLKEVKPSTHTGV